MNLSHTSTPPILLSPPHNNSTPPLLSKYVKPGIQFDALLHIYNLLQHKSDLNIYTDGSFLPHSSSQSMSVAWQLKDDPSIFFQSSFISPWPSSNRAELIAITCALLSSSLSSTINIYTDSSIAISTYNYVLSNYLLLYPRELFKIDNFLLWLILFDIISFNNLTLIFHKVLAHSKDPHNIKVDKLARLAHHKPSINFNETFIPYLNYLPLFNHIPIQRHLRHFLRLT